MQGYRVSVSCAGIMVCAMRRKLGSDCEKGSDNRYLSAGSSVPFGYCILRKDNMVLSGNHGECLARFGREVLRMYRVRVS